MCANVKQDLRYVQQQQQQPQLERSTCTAAAAAAATCKWPVDTRVVHFQSMGRCTSWVVRLASALWIPVDGTFYLAVLLSCTIECHVPRTATGAWQRAHGKYLQTEYLSK